jgi:hypothetical protein
LETAPPPSAAFVVWTSKNHTVVDVILHWRAVNPLMCRLDSLVPPPHPRHRNSLQNKLPRVVKELSGLLIDASAEMYGQLDDTKAALQEERYQFAELLLRGAHLRQEAGTMDCGAITILMGLGVVAGRKLRLPEDVKGAALSHAERGGVPKEAERQRARQR